MMTAKAIILTLMLTVAELCSHTNAGGRSCDTCAQWAPTAMTIRHLDTCAYGSMLDDARRFLVRL